MKKRIGFAVCNIVIMVISVFLLIYGMRMPSNITLEVCYGEKHPGQKAVLYYSTNYKVLGVEPGIEAEIENKKAVFELEDMELSDMRFRLDPIDVKEKCSWIGLNVYYNGVKVRSYKGEELLTYFEKIKKAKSSVKNEKITFKPRSEDPYVLFYASFSENLDSSCTKLRFLPFYICLTVYVLLAILYFIKYAKDLNKESGVGGWIQWIGLLIGNIFVCIGAVLNYAIVYLQECYGDVPFGQLLYHINAPLVGTNVATFSDVIITVICMVLVITLIVLIFYMILKKWRRQRGYALWVGILGIMLGSRAVILASMHFDLMGYYKYTSESSLIYEEHYADGKKIDLQFPEEKRNLIYIFLESMEITYASQEVGGGMTENLIPELTELAFENGCFSDGDVLNGAYPVQGATFTMGALAAQTSAVPIKEELIGNDTVNAHWESEDNYLPGVYAIGDVLQNAGYKQEFLIGSDATFAGRSSYFKGHGEYEIFDYFTAIEEQKIASDYKVWWGYEDAKLFDYAKEELMELSKGDEPFNFTMLTVDTHFTDGYLCEKCENQYESQYSNVIACSSRQVAEFINWIKEQEFYENTTIVIAGDHLTMDSGYIRAFAENFDRRVFTTIINPVEGCVTAGRQRTYTTLDLYPTTLAAIGVEIPGNRLGLGVNLYSDELTLAEEYGIDVLNVELLKNSKYYTNKLLYK